jgi:hypothetical protein
MICSENEFDIKSKRQRENINEEEKKKEEFESLKKCKLIVKKFEVREGRECDGDEESDDEEENNVKPIMRSKTR